MSDRDSRSRRDRSTERMAVDNESPIKIKGRGFASKDQDASRSSGRQERMDEDSALEPQRSIEGWIVIVRNVHEEADEESLTERFAEYGTVKNLHLNLDRRTGFVKGYALIEYETRKEAQTAIDDANNTKFLDQTISVDFAIYLRQLWIPYHKTTVDTLEEA
ncbi:RNA-binding protein 8A [Apophysomyces sp. BC1021]|nr:RNA-binding protein 8A [Apophysomyces sp. BC1021]